MPDSREVRRICGFLSVRQSRLHFDRVPDHRDRRGRRWKLDTLLFSTLLGYLFSGWVHVFHVVPTHSKMR